MAGRSTAPEAARRRWGGIRPRLIGVLLVPAIAALVFGALRVQEAASASSEAARAESLASALPDSFGLAVQLSAERNAVGNTSDERTREIREATDDDIAQWRSDAATIDYADNEPLQNDLLAINDALDDIKGLRASLDAPDTRAKARATYAETIDRLFGLSDRMPALADQALYNQSYALTNVSAAVDALDTEYDTMTVALGTGKLTPEQRTALTRAQGAWSDSTERFYRFTSPDAQREFDSVTNDTVRSGSTGAPMQEAVSNVVETGDIDDAGMSPVEWRAYGRDFLEQFERVIVSAADDLAADVEQVRSDAQRDAVISAVVTFVILFGAMFGAMLAARSIIVPLRRLRRAALNVARTDLPNQVRRIETADGPIDTSVEPIGIGRNDEIGEVAAAFDDVHAEAVRLAGEQAEMRANVNRMFVNLSRRSQGLVERQLRLIDELEDSEQDPDDLANLFRLDHLATRMRRNDESLLVLAGGEASHGNREDVGVIDVLRAAASEIEQYARVQIESSDRGTFRGRVAGDVVHLLAELIENATNFSPPDTQVFVRTSRSASDGRLTITVTDYGIGMTPPELEAANAKLRRTGELDADVARMMGLVVASRLAHRHGMTIVLGPSEPRGVVARVDVPASAFASDEPALQEWPQRAPEPAPEPRTPTAGDIINGTAPPPVWFKETAPSLGIDQQVGSFAEYHDQNAIGVNGVNPPRPPFGAEQSMSPPPSPERREQPSYAPEPGGGVADGDPLHDRLVDTGAGTDASPIFASLQSEWFMPRSTGEQRGRGSWESPGDEGWRRAAEVTEHREQPSVTPGGLPRRVPGQNLIPGAAAEDAGAAQEPASVPRRTSGLSNFQQGVNRARIDRTRDTDLD